MAYGRARISKDVDVHVSVKSLPSIQSWLREEDFVPVMVPDDLEQNYTGRIARWGRGPVTLDLLPGGVMDRQAKVMIPADWITRDSRELPLVLIAHSSARPFPVPRPEAIWAMKMQAGRTKDLSDLFTLVDVPIEIVQARDLFASRWQESLERKLRTVLRRIEDPKTMHDAISRLGLWSPTAQRNGTRWRILLERVRSAIPQTE